MFEPACDESEVALLAAALLADDADDAADPALDEAFVPHDANVSAKHAHTTAAAMPDRRDCCLEVCITVPFLCPFG